MPRSARSGQGPPPTATRVYWLRAYYGPGGRKAGQGRVGEREGDLCIEIWNLTEDGRALDLDILRKRDDIGKVDTWETSHR